MPISTEIKCDNCGAVKQATNHWYLVYMLRNKYITIMPFDFNLAQSVECVILCGEACTMKYISAQLSLLHASEPVKEDSFAPYTA